MKLFIGGEKMLRTTYLWNRMVNIIAVAIVAVIALPSIAKGNHTLYIALFTAVIGLGIFFIFWSRIIVNMKTRMVTIPSWIGKTDLNLGELERYDINSSLEKKWLDKGHKIKYTLTLYGAFGTKSINCGGGKAAHKAINDIKQANGING